jgi:hypothetical protein
VLEADDRGRGGYQLPHTQWPRCSLSVVVQCRLMSYLFVLLDHPYDAPASDRAKAIALNETIPRARWVSCTELNSSFCSASMRRRCSTDEITSGSMKNKMKNARRRMQPSDTQYTSHHRAVVRPTWSPMSGYPMSQNVPPHNPLFLLFHLSLLPTIAIVSNGVQCKCTG